MKAAPLVLLGLVIALASCNWKSKNESSAGSSKGETKLLQVGSIVITEGDVDLQLKDHHSGRSDEATRKMALDELASQAQFTAAALDEGLLQDSIVRAETGRILARRLKEKALYPRLKEIAEPIPESRLRELYQADESRFRSQEKRLLAVLWLSPGGDPAREKQYAEKLAAGRDFLFNDADLKDHPNKGFSVLAVDYSEHQASRYKGGIVGWLEREGNTDPWRKAVAEIGFSLEKPGEVSAVITRPEGVFLVRYMAQQPVVQRPFETVVPELERLERDRLRQKIESEFESTIKAKYPRQSLVPESRGQAK